LIYNLAFDSWIDSAEFDLYLAEFEEADLLEATATVAFTESTLGLALTTVALPVIATAGVAFAGYELYEWLSRRPEHRNEPLLVAPNAQSLANPLVPPSRNSAVPWVEPQNPLLRGGRGPPISRRHRRR